MQKYGTISIGKFLKLANELERRILITTRGKMGHYRFDSTSKSASVGEVLLATSEQTFPLTVSAKLSPTERWLFYSMHK